MLCSNASNGPASILCRNAFAAVMNDQGGGLLDVRADTLLPESVRVSSNRMRMFRNQTNASKGDGEKWVVRGGRVKKCLQFHFREYHSIGFFLENLF